MKCGYKKFAAALVAIMVLSATTASFDLCAKGNRTLPEGQALKEISRHLKFAEAEESAVNDDVDSSKDRPYFIWLRDEEGEKFRLWFWEGKVFCYRQRRKC